MNKIRVTAAALACAPLIAMSSGIAGAAPEPAPQPVPVAPTPVEVQPAVLSLFLLPPGAVLTCAPLLAVPVLGVFFPVCVV